MTSKPRATGVVLLLAHFISANGFLAQTSNGPVLPVSPRCKTTLRGFVGSFKDATEGCAVFSLIDNGVDAYHSLVRVGLCTDAEYVALKDQACQTTSPSQPPPSYATGHLYAAVDKIGQSCQAQLIACVKNSSVATMLKHTELYCGLLYLKLARFSFESCLQENDLCGRADQELLWDNACINGSWVVTPLVEFLDSRNTRCQQGLDSCTADCGEAKGLIQAERYCDALDVQVGAETVYQCSGQLDRCSAEEAKQMKFAMCSGGGTGKSAGRNVLLGIFGLIAFLGVFGFIATAFGHFI